MAIGNISMGFTQRVYEPVSERYLRGLMSFQKGVEPKMQDAIVKYLMSDESMRTRGAVTQLAEEFGIRPSNFHRQLARMTELQERLDLLVEELLLHREKPCWRQPLSYIDSEIIG